MAHAQRISMGAFTWRISSAATTWSIAGALAAVYLISTLPTPMYAVYREAFGFSPVVLTLIYAAYVVGSLAGMLFFGRLSDQIGRRPVVQMALGCAAAATVLFLLATSTPWLFAARIASGFAIALASGACTAWIIELQPPGERGRDGGRATQIAIGANLLGLGLGPLLAGVLTQYAPAPLRLSYVVLLPLWLASFALASLGRETVDDRKAAKDVSLQPRLGVPPEIRGRFVAPAIGAFATFAVLGFYAALVPGVLANALHQHNRAVAGATVGGTFLIATATISLLRMKPTSGMIAGLATLIPGVVLLVIAERAHSMALLLAASATVGVASGLGYRFGLQVVNAMAPPDRRSALVSAYLIVCYVAISLPVIGVGLVGAAWTPALADTIFGALVAVLAVAALAMEIVLRRRQTD